MLFFMSLLLVCGECLVEDLSNLGLSVSVELQIVGTGVPDGPAVKLLPYGEIAEKYIHKLNEFYDNISVESYIIMPDHIHMILSIRTDNPHHSGPSGPPVRPVQN